MRNSPFPGNLLRDRFITGRDQVTFSFSEFGNSMSNESMSFPIKGLCVKTLLWLRMKGKKHIWNPSFSSLSLCTPALGLWQHAD